MGRAQTETFTPAPLRLVAVHSWRIATRVVNSDRSIDFDDSDRDPLKLMISKVGRCRAQIVCCIDTFVEGTLFFCRAGIKALRGCEYSPAGRAIPATTLQRYAFAPGLSHDGCATYVEDRFRRLATLSRRLRSADGEKAFRRTETSSRRGTR